MFSGKIKECGCFGACIKISNEATFGKDVVLTLMAIVLWMYRGTVKPLFSKQGINTTIMVIAAVFSFGFQWWVLRHLPYNDCMPFKPGNNVWQEMQPGPNYHEAVYETKLVYEKNGQKQEFDVDKIPWQDTTWKFVEQKNKLVKEAVGLPEIHDFILNDSNNTDQTKAILTAPGYTFLWFVRRPDIAHLDNMDRIKTLQQKAQALHIPFYVLCSAARDVIVTKQAAWDMKNIPFMTLDVTASKTAMRTDPGLMLLKDGVVQKKWSYLDYPKDMALDNGNLEFK
jgi:hypothetical protein